MPEYMSDHVLDALRLCCFVACVACPLSISCVVCHVIFEACNVFSGRSCVYHSGPVFSGIAPRLLSPRSMFFDGSDRIVALAFAWSRDVRSHSCC